MKGSTIIILMVASVSASRFGLEDEFARTGGHSLTHIQRRSALSVYDRSVHSLAESKYIEKRLIAVSREPLPRLYGSYASDAVDAYAQETQLQARDLKEAPITATLIAMALLGTGGAGYLIGIAWHEYHKHEPRSRSPGRHVGAAPFDCRY
ncbi:hypothetical protein CF326_g2387 [Tilletia indica]|nr:hypothetical protein CF326_g2387 [Tilletia indica]